MAGELRAQIEAGGVDPIHVVPRQDSDSGEIRYTIYDGHQRVQQHRELGRESIDAIVRHDLAELGHREQEAEFLKFNLVRRQLHPLDQARIAMRVHELHKPLIDADGQVRHFDEAEPIDAELRDRIGGAIGMSGRNLSRYVAVLRCPREIQRLVRDGKLPPNLASRIAQLDEDVREDLACEIIELENPTEIKKLVKTWIDDHSRRRRPGPQATYKHALQRLTTALKNARDEIKYEEIVAPEWQRRFLADLEVAAKWLAGLVEQIRSIDSHARPMFEELDNAEFEEDNDV